MTTLLEEHLRRRANSLNELLSYSRQTILDCTERSKDVQEQAGQTLATIRVFLFDYEHDNPAHSTKIQEWWKNLLQSLTPFQALLLQIDTATEARTRLTRYEVRFQQAWGLPSGEILGSKYTPAAGFNKKTLQLLVNFAEKSSREEGQAALKEALRLRLHSDDDRPYRTREPYLVPSDVKKAEELYVKEAEARDVKKAEEEAEEGAEEGAEELDHRAIDNDHVTTRRKRKRVADEDRAFSVNCKQRCVDDNGLGSDGTARHLSKSPYSCGQSPSIELGRGVRSSLRSPNHHDSLDGGLMMDIGGSSAIGTPMAASTPTPSSQRPSYPCSPQPMLPPNSEGKEDMPHPLPQSGDQSSPTSITCRNRQLHFPTSNERQAGLQTARQDPIPFPHLINDTNPKHLRPNGLQMALYDHSNLDASESSSAQILLALGTPQPHKLPTTDLAGALSTLEPGKYLSASAVGLVLSTCCPDNARVIDSAYFNLSANNATPSNLRPCGDHVAKVFLPIHHGNHWTLAILDRQAHIITHYNSLPTKSAFRDALDGALPIFMSKIAADETFTTVTYEELRTQKNSYDCGVHILITALYIFADSAPSRCADTKLWRLIFRALLTGTIQTGSHLESIINTPEDASGDTLGANLDKYKARLIASRLSVAYAESALDLLNQISSQIAASTLAWSQLPDICTRFSSSFSELEPFRRVFESLPDLNQVEGVLDSGLIKGDRLRKEYAKAEKSVRAAIDSARTAKDIRTEDGRRLSLRMQEIADATREKGERQIAAAQAEIEASKQLHQLLCEK